MMEVDGHNERVAILDAGAQYGKVRNSTVVISASKIVREYYYHGVSCSAVPVPYALKNKSSIQGTCGTLARYCTFLFNIYLNILSSVFEIFEPEVPVY
jgi:hypothetical protein